MATEDSTDGQWFLMWQNIFVVMGGGGIAIVLEHHVLGSICIAVGIIGCVLSTYRKKSDEPWKSSLAWLLALLITWAAVSYDYYDRHSNSLLEFDDPRQTTSLVKAWQVDGTAAGKASTAATLSFCRWRRTIESR